MIRTLLGVVDSFGGPRGAPGARLRPLFEASSDKTRWDIPEEDFPNSGVVSWWQPVPDAEHYAAWTFNVERSRTYDPDNRNHDYYGVKGAPSLAVELIDFPDLTDSEDIRVFLVEEGLPLKRCATKRLAFRDASGLMLGPLELSLRDGRLFLVEREALIPVSRSGSDTALETWKHHRFLPLENWSRKVGEVDFSPNTVFVKRVLREIRDISPTTIENAKLTEKLMASYSASLANMSLTHLQSQRLKRLHRLSAETVTGVALAEEAIPDVLSLPTVKTAIATAIDEAVAGALQGRRTTLTQLDKQRTALEEEIQNLRTEAERQRSELDSIRSAHTTELATFDDRVGKKFQDIAKDASSFLTDIAVIRAALSTDTRSAHSAPATTLVDSPPAETLEATKILLGAQESFEANGLARILSTSLLSAWSSGYVPMCFGTVARDALSAASETLFGGKIHFAALGPTLSSVTDLLALPATSSRAVSTLRELVIDPTRSDELTLLVFDNVNLCQLDSVLLPLLRAYVTFHAGLPTSRSPVMYPTPLGLWPSNLFLAGILIDSPFALPISRELWTYSAFVNAGGQRARSKGKGTDPPPANPLSQVKYCTWLEWLDQIEQQGTSDTRMLAAHVIREVESSAIFKRIIRRLAAAIDHAGTDSAEANRATLLAEMTIAPYLVSRGVDLASFLEHAPADISTGDGVIDLVTTTFEKWGLELK